MTATPNKGYTLPTVGADFGTWGTELNADITAIDTNLGGLTSVNCAGNSNITASAGQAQNLVQQLTGVLTGSIQYILPSAGGFYVIENNTTGNYNITVITSGGTGVYVAQGTSAWVYCDGTNIVQATPSGWQEVASYAFSAQSTVAIPLPTIFRKFRLNVYNTQISVTGNSIYLQFSSDGGATYNTTTNAWVALVVDAAGNVTSSQNAADVGIPLSGLLLASTAQPFDCTTDIYPGSGSQRANARTFGSGYSSSNLVFEITVSGSVATTAALMNFMRLVIAAGTMTGNAVLEGLP